MESSIIGYCILALSLALLAASGCLLIFGKRVNYSYSVSSSLLRSFFLILLLLSLIVLFALILVGTEYSVGPGTGMSVAVFVLFAMAIPYIKKNTEAIFWVFGAYFLIEALIVLITCLVSHTPILTSFFSFAVAFFAITSHRRKVPAAIIKIIAAIALIYGVYCLMQIIFPPYDAVMYDTDYIIWSSAPRAAVNVFFPLVLLSATAKPAVRSRRLFLQILNSLSVVAIIIGLILFGISLFGDFGYEEKTYTKIYKDKFAEEVFHQTYYNSVDISYLSPKLGPSLGTGALAVVLGFAGIVCVAGMEDKYKKRDAASGKNTVGVNTAAVNSLNKPEIRQVTGTAVPVSSVKTAVPHATPPATPSAAAAAKINTPVIKTAVQADAPAADAVQQNASLKNDAPPAGYAPGALSRRQFVLDYLAEHPSITSADVCTGLNISLPTANRILSDLLQDGTLERVRVGRAYSYHLSGK